MKLYAISPAVIVPIISGGSSPEINEGNFFLSEHQALFFLILAVIGLITFAIVCFYEEKSRRKNITDWKKIRKIWKENKLLFLGAFIVVALILML